MIWLLGHLVVFCSAMTLCYAATCVSTCVTSGNFQSCTTCGGYVSCNWSFKYDMLCNGDLVWDDTAKLCLTRSTTCSEAPAPAPAPRPDPTSAPTPAQAPTTAAAQTPTTAAMQAPTIAATQAPTTAATEAPTTAATEAPTTGATQAPTTAATQAPTTAATQATTTVVTQAPTTAATQAPTTAATKAPTTGATQAPTTAATQATTTAATQTPTTAYPVIPTTGPVLQESTTKFTAPPASSTNTPTATSPTPFEKRSLTWEIWTRWSACTKSCGTGEQHSALLCSVNKSLLPCRDKLYTAGNTSHLAYAVRSRSCRHVTCPVDEDWAPWGDWGHCSPGCGQGTRSRVRHCPPSNHGCEGNSVQWRTCDALDCNETDTETTDDIGVLTESDRRASAISLGAISIISVTAFLGTFIALDCLRLFSRPKI